MFPRVDRKEFKFIIPLELRDQVIKQVELYTGFDEAAGGCSHYPIISQYYDNPNRDSYWEKQRSQKSRRKLRVRVYGSHAGTIPPTTFIEVKHKHYGRGVKRRLQLPMAEAIELVENAKSTTNINEMSRSNRMVTNEIINLIKLREFKFLCTMRYDRQAFVGGADAPDLRITFDTGVACRFDHLDLQADDKRFDHYILPNDQCVMEVKTNTVIPYWLRQLVGEKSMVNQSFSKFCTALERHDPVISGMLRGKTA